MSPKDKIALSTFVRLFNYFELFDHVHTFLYCVFDPVLQISTLTPDLTHISHPTFISSHGLGAF